MSERRITRRRGEAIHIHGPATIRVNRRVTLTVEAPHDERIDRVDAPPSRDAHWPTRPPDSAGHCGNNAHFDDERSRNVALKAPSSTS